MQPAGQNPERDHKHHNHPAFRIEKRKRTTSVCFPFDPSRMLQIKTPENKIEKYQKDPYGFAYPK